VIRAWQYREGVEKVEVSVDPLPPIDPSALLWVACDQPTDAELEQLGKQLQLFSFVLEDLRHAGQRTKLDHYSEHFHVAFHDCELQIDDGTTQLLTREVDVVFSDGWLLSVCQPSETGDTGRFPIDEVQDRFDRQRGEDGSTDEGFLLWALLDVLVDRYFDVGDAVDERLDQLQEVVLDDTVDRIRRGRPRELFDLSKSLLRFRRSALPLREVVGQLLRKEDPNISEAAVVHFRDVYDHVLRVSDLVESQRDLLTGLRDADLAVTSNQMSLIQQKIAAWGAILVIATLVTGVLGMNFQNVPGVGWEVGFLVVGLIDLGLSVPLYLYFKRRNWL
jgi:magnesium transporter